MMKQSFNTVMAILNTTTSIIHSSTKQKSKPNTLDEVSLSVCSAACNFHFQTAQKVCGFGALQEHFQHQLRKLLNLMSM